MPTVNKEMTERRCTERRRRGESHHWRLERTCKWNTAAPPPLSVKTKGEADEGGRGLSFFFKADAETSLEYLSMSEFIIIHISLL